MADFVASVFRITSPRSGTVPRTAYEYREVDTEALWQISAGGSRGYLIRSGEGIARDDAKSVGEQAADSHFMISRLLSALLLGGHGLFHADMVGRFFVRQVEGTPEWLTQLNSEGPESPEASEAVYDWLGAFARHEMLRRAANDAHLALTHPVEAGLYVYRGLEWLVVGEGRSWDDLAGDLGISKEDLRDFKRLVNVDYGVRHASRSGQKLRAEVENYGTWVAGLIDALNASRGRLEEDYEPATPETVAAAVISAMAIEPYE